MNLKYITTSFLCVSSLLTTVYADTDIVDESNLNRIKSITEIKIAEPKKLKAVDYQIKVNLTEETPSVPTYKAELINIKKLDSMGKIANIFNFSSEKDKIHTNHNNSLSRMITDNRGNSIEYFDSGAIFFSKETMIPEKSEDILHFNGLDKKSAKTYYSNKATGFLKRHNLFKNGSFLKNVSFATVQKMSPEDFENLEKGIKPLTSDAKIVSVAVHFGYKIGDIKTWGAGSETTLYFDKLGVSGYFNQIRNFSEIENSKITELISSKVAVARYTSNKQPKTIFRSSPMVIKNVLIENIELVYHLKAVNVIQQKIEPKYLISGTFMGVNLEGKEVTSKFEWAESAIK